MTFKTLEDIQDRAKMKATLKGLRRLKRPTPFLFKARCDALDGSPLLLVSAPGKRLDAGLVKLVRLGTRSIRGTVCREDNKLVFSTVGNVNKPQMAKLISRVGTQNGANLPLKRIEIRTPKDKKKKADSPPPPKAPETTERASSPQQPPRKPTPKPERERPSPRERARRLRERAPVVPEPEPAEATFDTSALEADLANWRTQLAQRRAAAEQASGKVSAAEAHLAVLRAAAARLAAVSDLQEMSRQLLALSEIDDDPELPGLAARAAKAQDASQMQELVSEWFEDVGEEHRWEIESLREASAERSQEAEEMAQLVASVEQVLAQS